MIDPASGLRYDPSDDDAHPPRGPAALLRILTQAGAASPGAHSAIDVYEQACRALTEHGITAAVLTVHPETGRYSVVAHRLTTDDLQRPVEIPEFDRLEDSAAFYLSGTNPLARAFGIQGPFGASSIAARIAIPASDRTAVLFLAAADLGREHLAAVEALAALLGANVARVEATGRARELAAAIDQRVRSRTREMVRVIEQTPPVFGARWEIDAVRVMLESAHDALDGDGLLAIVCIHRRHHVLAAPHRPGVLAAQPSLAVRLREGFRLVAGPNHASCVDTAVVETVPPGLGVGASSSSDIGIGATAEELLDAPIVAGGAIRGLLALVRPAGDDGTADQMRLLYLLANVLGAAIDQARQRRRDERQRLSAVLEGLRDGVAVCDGEGHIFAVNRRGRRLLTALGGDDDQPDARTLALIQAALAPGGSGQAAGALPVAGSPSERVAVIATRAEGASNGPAVVLAVDEVTDADVLRERLIQSEKMASIGQLVSGVAHELNNPLTGILGFAQLLQMRALDPAARREAETIAAEAERASKIVQNLLSFARRRRPEKVRLDLNTLIHRVVELWLYGLRAGNIEVREDLSEDLPPCLVDPQQIQQVLLNILTNAAHALRSTRTSGLITISTSEVDDHARIRICDNGPGIPPENLRRVFDPFFTTKAPGEGTGLGLAISYGIVEEHHGRIAVESAPGGGACFSIDLPLAGIDAPSAGPDLPAPVEPSGTGSRILVIDDEPTIRNLLAGVLGLDGHHVEVAASAEAALAALGGSQFDAVLTDVRMPGMDGMDFYRQVKERYPDLAPRVIFISGDNVSRETRQFIESAAIPFLPKPFTIRGVREAVAAVLGEEHGPQDEPPPR